MYLQLALLAPLLSLANAAAAPAVTIAPRSPAHHQLIQLRELEMRAAVLNGRQSGSLSFCFGRNSICEQSNNLNDKCDSLYDLNSPTKWYECLCTNGYVSTRQACGWCQDAYNLDQMAGINELNSRQCTSYSFSIAPVPESILSIQTSYNSTYTGTILGGKATSAGGSASTTSASSATRTGGGDVGIGATALTKTGGDSTSTRTSARTSATGLTTESLDGGGSFPTVTRTLIAGGADPSSVSSGSGNGGTSAATSLQSVHALCLSVLAFGFAAVFVM